MTYAQSIEEQLLRRHEGNRNTLYLDTQGNLTGGIGHLFCVGSYLPVGVIERLFHYDLSRALDQYDKFAEEEGITLDRIRKAVLVCMFFNLGKGVYGFKKMIAALRAEDYETAAREMLSSKWAVQVGKKKPSKRFPKGQRAWELAEMMRTGEG